jgi:hypothetical protein
MNPSLLKGYDASKWQGEVVLIWLVGLGVYLLLLLNFPRSIFALTIIGISLAVFLKEQESAALAKKKAMVSITITHDLKKCAQNIPLFINIINKSGSSLNKVSFAIAGYRKGYSSPIYKSPADGYQTHQIIAANNSWDSCRELPKLSHSPSDELGAILTPNILSWKSEGISINFVDQ